MYMKMFYLNSSKCCKCKQDSLSGEQDCHSKGSFLARFHRWKRCNCNKCRRTRQIAVILYRDNYHDDVVSLELRRFAPQGSASDSAAHSSGHSLCPLTLLRSKCSFCWRCINKREAFMALLECDHVLSHGFPWTRGTINRRLEWMKINDWKAVTWGEWICSV